MEDAKKALDEVKANKKDFEVKDLLNPQERKLMNNLENRSKLLKTDIISPEMQKSIDGGIDPEKHPSIYNDALDHIKSGDCRHCIKLVARHERNDTEFPLDGNIVNMYQQSSLAILDHAQSVFDIAQKERQEAERLNKETKELLEEPIQVIIEKVKIYLRYAFIGGGGLGFAGVLIGFLFDIFA